MLKRSILLLGLLVFTACNNTDNDTKNSRSINTSFEVIKSSKIPSNYLEYSQGKKSLSAYYSDSQNDIEKFDAQYELISGEKAPDFQGTMLIVKSGTKNSDGYGIYADSIKDGDRYMEVTIIHAKAGHECLVNLALTNPYEIVFLANSHKEVKFIEKNITTTCEK